MLNLISDALTSGDVVGFIAVFAAVCVTIFVVVIALVVKRIKSSPNNSASVHGRSEQIQRQRNAEMGNLATALRERKEKMSMSEQRQRARTTQSDCDDAYHTHDGNKVVANSDGHTHSADNEERYDKIVGSLGEVDDEGCLDLDGVRLIVEDVAYSSDTESRDYTEIAKAVVLGDIINSPRFKTNYRKK